MKDSSHHTKEVRLLSIGESNLVHGLLQSPITLNILQSGVMKRHGVKILEEGGWELASQQRVKASYEYI